MGEVRRKVQEMTWKEGEQPQDWEEIKDDEVAEAKALATGDSQEQEPVSASSEAAAQSPDLKRKALERNASSVLESSEPAKKSKDSPSVSLSSRYATFPTSCRY